MVDSTTGQLQRPGDSADRLTCPLPDVTGLCDVTGVPSEVTSGVAASAAGILSSAIVMGQDPVALLD